MSKRIKDLKNQRFGKLLVLERDLEYNKTRCFWKCKCDCGRIKTISSSHLINGNSKSCGLCLKDDLVGKRFNFLQVISKENKSNWRCKCDCGEMTVVRGDYLKNGRVKSCGCYQKQRVKETQTTHNMSKTRLYGIYYNMKSRCYNKNEKRYKDYGLRGISICDEWLNNVSNFINWSLDNGYEEHLTLDRIDNDGNYEPSNCRWADKETQYNNRRNSILININGIKKSLKQWTIFMGWKYPKYYARYSKNKEIFTKEEIKIIEEKIKKKG